VGDRESPEKYAGLKPEAGRELDQFLARLLDFFSVTVIPQISEYYDENLNVDRNSYRLVDAINLVEWIVSILPDFDGRLWPTLSALLDACRRYNRPVDFNIAAVGSAFALFPLGTTEQLIVPMFNGIFVDCSPVSQPDIAVAAEQFWKFASRCRRSWPDLVLCPSFRSVFRALFLAESQTAATIVDDLLALISPLFPSAPEVRSAVIHLFSGAVSPRSPKLVPFVPALFELEPEAFPHALSQGVFSSLAAGSLSDDSLQFALSLGNSNADRLARVPLQSLTISYPAVAAATARPAIADPLWTFLDIWGASDDFHARLAGALDAHGSADALLRIELHRAAPDFARCIAVARRSPPAVEAVLTKIAEQIPVRAAAAQFARDSVPGLLMAETLLTAATEHFYRVALAVLTDDAIVDVFLSLMLELEDSAEALAKAALIFALRPDCRERFEELVEPEYADAITRTDLWHPPDAS
jgi:hypothetical protein